MSDIKQIKMKEFILFCCLILSCSSIHLDEESTIKLQDALDSIPFDKIPTKFKARNDDKYFLKVSY
jgi:hypothetical protein